MKRMKRRDYRKLVKKKRKNKKNKMKKVAHVQSLKPKVKGHVEKPEALTILRRNKIN